MKISTRFGWRLLRLCAATSFIAASLQIAAPLHAEQHVCQSACPEKQQSSSSEIPEHDADNCSICQYFFGVSGKTLLPQITANACQPVELFFETIAGQTLVTAHSVCRIIPRAPPV